MFPTLLNHWFLYFAITVPVVVLTLQALAPDMRSISPYPCVASVQYPLTSDQSPELKSGHADGLLIGCDITSWSDMLRL
ncbi:hypothetical protein GSI_08404 [Ganoderma sinense ZZ0214-1]|uniref:Uncharacterized protein n=1 Tax=Ganoderma sinense ZZ0214-1 TaxID=1077348 RepID=A0A2G8S6Q6_9APHY|nr:hypothetical protein GSI_08404 [Ganoderma sinense ZZ0214-1]